ncbi:MAG: HAD family phosphatase [Candidatus Brocadiae bacterium]|nr:HAD family phosphatase [Candidatus Brocadiia bacterium]
MAPSLEPQLGVIFDLDGVMVDSEPLHVEAWQALFAREGLEVTHEEYHHGIGMLDADWIDYLFGRRGRSTDATWWQNEKRQIYRGVLAAAVRPFPGVVALVRRLHEAGVALGVASNSWRENIETVLHATALTHCFGVLTGKEDVTRPKPHPEPYLTTAAKLGVPPRHCTVIEDSDLGIQAAKAAGMRCIAVPNSLPPERLAQADWIVDSLDRTEAVCKRVMGAGGREG